MIDDRVMRTYPSFDGHASGLAPYHFEHDHEQYMSLAGPEMYIPPSLEERAKAALKELQEVHEEFQRIAEEYETMHRLREEKFEDAMSHFQSTKDHWVRHEDLEGNIHWVDTSYMTPPKNEMHWPFGDTSGWA